MYIIQIGNYAWLSYGDLLTTSIQHAARYPTQDAAKALAQRFSNNRSPALANLNQRQRDFYATDSTPVTVIEAEALDKRIQLLTRPGDRGDIPTVMPKPADKEATVRKEGITRQIYNWTLANPQATKADALAAWPGANPSTVSVQFSAARRSQVS